MCVKGEVQGFNSEQDGLCVGDTARDRQTDLLLAKLRTHRDTQTYMRTYSRHQRRRQHTKNMRKKYTLSYTLNH